MEDFKIITIKGPHNSEASFCPLRGGVITSLKFNNKEVLYFDQETFVDKGKNIRGGIPILFPNAGALNTNSTFSKLKQHGFARDLQWFIENKEGVFVESLSSNSDTKEIYPYDFKISVSGYFEEDMSFTLKQVIENLEDSIEMPISIGLHPYFKVLNSEKRNIKFNFVGGREIEDNFDIWANGGTFYIDNPKIKDQIAVLKVDIPKIGEMVIDVNNEYEKIWVWSLPGSDFVCIEPMERGLNGLIDNPKMIKPHDKLSTSINFKLKE
jgi:galactose mutarotase-like enzyme